MNRKEFLSLGGGAALAAIWGAGRPVAMPAVPKHWVWVRGDFTSLEAWKPQFARWREAGIRAILPNVHDAEVVRRVASAARDEGLETHAWIFTMMRGGMEDEHPEWYAVNRRGESTAVSPPYVDYYRFLCPSREQVRAHLRAHVAEFAEVDHLVSVHLDYVRYPDVILPRALWEQYGLVQDRELPEFDYCYCDECRAQYRDLTGEDPHDFEDPSRVADWARFRWDSITRVVSELADTARYGSLQITAAVFPTPEIARALVRQDWTRWDLDAVLPMLYHSFYEQPVDWIEKGVREGTTALAGRFPLYAGLYVPELSPAELETAVRGAHAAGAAGVSLFESQVPTEAHWRALASVTGTA